MLSIFTNKTYLNIIREYRGSSPDFGGVCVAHLIQLTVVFFQFIFAGVFCTNTSGLSIQFSLMPSVVFNRLFFMSTKRLSLSKTCLSKVSIMLTVENIARIHYRNTIQKSSINMNKQNTYINMYPHNPFIFVYSAKTVFLAVLNLDTITYPSHGLRSLCYCIWRSAGIFIGN